MGQSLHLFSQLKTAGVQTGKWPKRLWDNLIGPSPRITGADQRRQAALLSGFLLGLIVTAIVAEAAAVAMIDWGSYTGYRQTIATVLILAVIYAISRTEHLQMAASLAVVAASLAVFITGWLEPRGVLGGLLDFLIVPLWLGSLYISQRRLITLIALILAGLLLFPYLAPAVTLNDILVGPFTFTVMTAILLLIMTQHRNLLEQDRQAELAAKELRSRQEAARAEALLRVAHRFNAQLDLAAVLDAISEEVARALNTSLSFVSLYERDLNQLRAVAGVGLPTDEIQKIGPLPKPIYDRLVAELGQVFTVPEVKPNETLSRLAMFELTGVRTMAFASMEYERELIGCLGAMTTGEWKEFTQEDLLLLRGLADQAALAIVNTTLYKDAQRRLEQLQALRTIEITIATSHDLRETLDVLLEKIIEQLKVDAAVFLLLNENQQLEFTASHGFNTPTLRFTRLRLGEGMAGRAALQRKTLYIQDLRTDPQTLAYSPTLAQEGFASYFATPLIAQGQIKGVLEIFHRTLLTPDEEWLAFLAALADQAAIAIESTSLFENLQQANDEIMQAYDTTIEGWSHALDLRDHETEGHTQRVTKMTMQLAEAMGLSKEELVHIRRGALLHDIGKMGVPDHILLKTGQLSQEEWEIMRKHPVYAYEMLAPIAYLRTALDIPYCHHEKWDGSGYPRGLKGEEIPLAARIFAFADVYDALTSDRPYRKAWSEEETCAYIQSLSGTHFDPQAVDAFLRIVS